MGIGAYGGDPEHSRTLRAKSVVTRMCHPPAKRLELGDLDVARIGAGLDGANPAVRADLHAPPRYFRDSNIKELRVVRLFSRLRQFRRNIHQTRSQGSMFRAVFPEGSRKYR
jgi:hypothetical protein